MGNGTPLACSKLGGVARAFIFIIYLFVVKFSVLSCLGKLSYEISVCIEVYHSFVGESCICEHASVYDGILMRSLTVFFTALGILSTQSTLYADSYGSIDLIYQVWL